MTTLVPNGVSVTVVRGGKRIKVRPGTAFDFTDAEIAAVKKGGSGSLRAPVNEVVAPLPDEEAEGGKKAAPKAKGGKKPKEKQPKPESKPETEGDDDDDADDDGDDDEDI